MLDLINHILLQDSNVTTAVTVAASSPVRYRMGPFFRVPTDGFPAVYFEQTGSRTRDVHAVGVVEGNGVDIYDVNIVVLDPNLGTAWALHERVKTALRSFNSVANVVLGSNTYEVLECRFQEVRSDAIEDGEICVVEALFECSIRHSFTP